MMTYRLTCSTNTIRIRLFEPLDLESVYRIECRSFLFPWSRSVFNLYYTRNSIGFLVALINKRIVGYIVTELDSMRNRGHIVNIAVDSEFRSKSIGKRLVKAIISSMKNSGVKELWLEVRVSNLVARKFYVSLGFVEGTRITGYYLDEDAVFMTKRL